MKCRIGNRLLQRKSSSCTVALLFAQSLLMVPVLSAVAEENNADNVYFYGALVAEPCIISPGDEEIQLDFGTIVGKYLYQNTRTVGKPFEIHLTQCDLSIGKVVRISFQGTESLALPGFLAVNDSSEAKGIAIGLETAVSNPLPFNQESDSYTLKEGANIIALNAYVQGEPKAITDKAIVFGAFSAVATFNLKYE